jgi:CBS domain-containing protein
MPKVMDVMTRSLATCVPDAPVAQAVRTMRDMKIGDILVVDEAGKLKGIVTDRDLAIGALAADTDMRMAPVSDYMTTGMVTGQPNWDLAQAAKVMSQHQVRRLPIVDGGQLVGIVSLGDVATYAKKQTVAGESLRSISEPKYMRRSYNAGRGLLALFGLAAALVGAVLLATDLGKDLRDRVADEWPELAESLKDYGRRLMPPGNVDLSSQQHMGAQERA